MNLFQFSLSKLICFLKIYNFAFRLMEILLTQSIKPIVYSIILIITYFKNTYQFNKLSLRKIHLT